VHHGKQEPVRVVRRQAPAQAGSRQRGGWAGLRVRSGARARAVRGHRLPERHLLRVGADAARRRAEARVRGRPGVPRQVRGW